MSLELTIHEMLCFLYTYVQFKYHLELRTINKGSNMEPERQIESNLLSFSLIIYGL